MAKNASILETPWPDRREADTPRRATLSRFVCKHKGDRPRTTKRTPGATHSDDADPTMKGFAKPAGHNGRLRNRLGEKPEWWITAKGAAADTAGNPITSEV